MESGHNYTSAYKAITDVASRNTDNLVVVANSGTTYEVKAYGFKVMQTQRRVQRVDNLPELDDDEELPLGYIGENGHEQDGGIADPGKDVFRVEGDAEEVIEELGFAVQPDDLLVGAASTRTDTPILGIQGDRASGWNVDRMEGGTGGVYSQETRTDEDVPTTALSENAEQGLINIQEDEEENRIRVGFKNVSGATETPSIYVRGRRYIVTPVEDHGVVEEMVSNTTPARIVTWGSLQNTETQYKEPSDWEAVDFGRDEVESLIVG